MTAEEKAEKIARWERAFAAEEFFPGVLGNPVIYAAKWGLPLSRGYVKHLQRHKTMTDKTGRGKRRKARRN